MRHANFAETAKISAPSATQTRDGGPAGEKTTLDSMSFIRHRFQSLGVSRRTEEILLTSCRDSTWKQYTVYIKQWRTFAGEWNLHPIRPRVIDVLEFFTLLFDSGLKYSAINTARAALSTFIVLDNNITIGQHPLIKRFLRAVFLQRPTLPRYSLTWDVKPVLDYLASLHPLDTLTLRLLTFKLVMLIALVTGQRCQTLHLMDLRNMNTYQHGVKFLITEPVKQSAPNRQQPVLVLPEYTVDEKVCVVTCLRRYLDCTSGLRDCQKLFVSYARPYRAVSRETISRWIKTVMAASGIDTAIFKPHSVRAASTSKAREQSVPLQNILTAAGWSNAQTFATFYQKPTSSITEDSFASGVLADN